MEVLLDRLHAMVEQKPSASNSLNVLVWGCQGFDFRITVLPRPIMLHAFT